jgi:hypothetical protein
MLSCSVYKPEPLELVIHTTKNTYYINGLAVTNKNNPYEVIIFDTQKELSEYLKKLTEDENR